jgi:hypothetical protein
MILYLTNAEQRHWCKKLYETAMAHTELELNSIDVYTSLVRLIRVVEPGTQYGKENDAAIEQIVKMVLSANDGKFVSILLNRTPGVEFKTDQSQRV